MQKYLSFSIPTHSAPYLALVSRNSSKHFLRKTSVISVSIIPPFTIKHNTSSPCSDAIMALFEQYVHLVTTVRPNFFQSKDTVAVKFHKLVQIHWLKTKKKIKAVRLARDDRILKILQRWKEIGISLSISKKVKSNICVLRWGHSCHWQECLCSNGSTHTFRVCKGCWGKFYCSVMCQAS